MCIRDSISCVLNAQMWYMDSDGNLGELQPDLVRKQQKNDPETFLARVAVIAEGITEIGFLSFFLERALGSLPLDHGIRVCNGRGNDQTCLLLKALDKSGLKFAGLADNEGSRLGTWSNLKQSMGDHLLQWTEGCTEDAVISAIPDEHIPQLIGTSDDENYGYRLKQLMDRCGARERTLQSIEIKLAETDKTLKQLVIEASSGNTDGAADKIEKSTWKSHSSSWFKSEQGGRELAEKALELGGWRILEPKLVPLITAILASADLAITEKFPNV